MRTRIVRIGNSQGIRIPKVLLEELGLEGEVELRVEEDRLVIESARVPRAGWEEEARTLVEAEESAVGPWAPSDFDEGEWVWEE